MAWRLPTWADISGGVLRMVGYRWEEPKQLPTYGASSGPVGATFEPAASMSAYVEFPWVRACVNAIADDLAGLPLRLTRGTGPDAEVVEEHEVLALLDKPVPGMTRRQWERQLLTYWLPTGYVPILLVPANRPTSLVLLHPETVRPVADEYGMLAGVEYTRPGSTVMHIGAEALSVVSAPSWRSGDAGLLGEGLISAVKHDLNAELGAMKLSAAQANRGKPEVVLSPAEAGAMLTKDQTAAVADAYSSWANSKKPALVLSGALKAEWPHFTLRDMEFSENRKLTRETILALFGVPPARVGLPNTNYATAKQQDTVYWTSLRAKASVIDDALTAIVQRYDRTLYVAHDFSGVPALQESRDARLERVVTWQALGADAAEAAAYEGFAESPLTPGQETPAEPAPTPSKGASVHTLFRAVGHDVPLAALLDVAPVVRAMPADEEGRAVVWRSWLSEVHAPQERALARATRKALNAQRDRILARLAALPIELSADAAVRRDLVSDLLSMLMPPDEARQWSDSMRAAVRDVIEAGYRDGATQLGKPWVIDGSAADVLTERRLGELITYTDPTTRQAVGEAISAGIAEGETVNEIATRIRTAHAFSPSRSLLIARTETTRSLSAGHVATYARYEDEEGVTMRKQWLSARDGEVRDAHAFLDGQERAVGEDFVVPAGEYAGSTASGPGQFAAAALVCNCRCTTVPIVEVA